MEDMSFPVYSYSLNKKQTLFSVNDIQVIFNTDIKTAKKLEDDEVLKDYLQAVIQANLLAPHGIVNTTQITSIERLDACDPDKVIVALDITTNVQQGVEELRCCITEEKIFSEIEEPTTSEDSSLSWNQQVPDVTSGYGTGLRWNSEMTTLLIQARGDLDREFSRAKYKFRLWEKVAMKLNTQLLNVKVTAKDCDDKWRNIVATYRKNIDKMKCFGDNSVRWEYFSAMDDILKGTKDLADGTNKAENDERMARLISELNNTEFVNTEQDPIEVVNFSPPQISDEEMEAVYDDDCSQNAIITRKFSDEKRKWTTEMCLTLLFYRFHADTKFKENYENTPNLWKELTNQMNEKFSANFLASELESVWSHCMVTYEINLENLKSKGVNTVKWKYFAVMDELLGGTNEIADLCVPRPGEYLLSEFHNIMKSNVFTTDILHETDPLGFNGNLTDNLNNDSDSDEHLSFLSGTLWTKDMVKTLITLKKQINQEMAANRIPRKKQWVVMVRRLRTLNIKVTEDSCEEKWRNLLRTYKKNLLRVQKHGSIVKWPWFWKMREVVGNTVLVDFPKKPSSLHKEPTNTTLKPANSTMNGNTSSGSSNSLDTNFRFSQKSLSDFIDDAEDLLNDRSNELYENPAGGVPVAAIPMLSDDADEAPENQQMRLIREMFEQQNKVIEALHKEQQSIKSLLTQILQKLT